MQKMNDKYEVNQHKSISKINSLVQIFKKLLLQRNVLAKNSTH